MTVLESPCYALQMVERAADETEAQAMKQGFLMQDGLIGVSVLAPTRAKPGWRVQAFFQDEPNIAEAEFESLGIRRVLLMPTMLARLERRNG